MDGISPSAAGMVPSMLLLPRSNIVRDCNEPRSSGRVDSSEQDVMCISERLDKPVSNDRSKAKFKAFELTSNNVSAVDSKRVGKLSSVRALVEMSRISV